MCIISFLIGLHKHWFHLINPLFGKRGDLKSFLIIIPCSSYLRLHQLGRAILRPFGHQRVQTFPSITSSSHSVHHCSYTQTHNIVASIVNRVSLPYIVLLPLNSVITSIYFPLPLVVYVPLPLLSSLKFSKDSKFLLSFLWCAYVS